MDNLISNEWLEFPLAVFIDTQVFINESYDFSERGKLDLLKKQIDNGKVELLTTEIVIREVERHMKDDIGKGLEKLNNALFDRRLAVFREGHYSGIFKNIDSSTMISNAIQKFNDYLFNEHNKEEFPPAHTAEHLLNQVMIQMFHCSLFFRIIELILSKVFKPSDFPLFCNVSMIFPKS